MNKYRVTFYFVGCNNYETHFETEEGINEFTQNFANKLHLYEKKQNFIIFSGENDKYILNLDNVLYYTIVEEH